MKHITLVGMSGVGKSTVGKRLARGKRQFFDTDELLERNFGQQPLPEVLQHLGSEGFIRVESAVIREHAWPAEPPLVIATGGSVIYVDETMGLLRSFSKIVYLSAPLEVIMDRGPLEGRGIVCRQGSTFQDVFLEREPLYEKWADVIVNANAPVADVVRDIMGQLGR
jgi:shikimate kinase